MNKRKHATVAVYHPEGATKKMSVTLPAALMAAVDEIAASSSPRMSRSATMTEIIRDSARKMPHSLETDRAAIRESEGKSTQACMTIPASLVDRLTRASQKLNVPRSTLLAEVVRKALIARTSDERTACA